MYQVFARKWRPQKFDELVGQKHVSRTLSNAIEGDRLAHAYIFSGLRGTGKTTVARILAKCLNCEAGPTIEPDGSCASCLEIAESRSMDVMEIDAASRTKVEQTRELLEVVTYAPVRDRYKVLIIDEAHMLSKASFNALLKTLEEPPPNVVFVLATTELQRILPTILSRCQVFDFRRVTTAEMSAHLRRICDDEKIEVPDAALERLARAGEGSVRDSLSLLERAVAFCGTTIAEDDVLRMLGAVRGQVLVEFVGALAERDAAAMLKILDRLVDEGHDLLHFWNALIAAQRDLLLQRALPECEQLMSRPPDEAQALIAAAEALTREDLLRTFQITADLENGLKMSSQPRFLFEATLIKLASLGDVRPIEELLARFESGVQPAKRSRPTQKKKLSDSAASSKAVENEVDISEVIDSGADDSASEVAETGALVAAIGERNPMLGAMLAEALILRDANAWTLRFPADMEFILRQTEAKENIAVIREEASRLAGGPVEVRLELSRPEKRTPSPVSTQPAVAPPQPEAAPLPPEPPEPAIDEPGEDSPDVVAATPPPPVDNGWVEEVKKEAGVKKLIETFGAHVIRARRHDEGAAKKKTRPLRAPEETA